MFDNSSKTYKILQSGHYFGIAKHYDTWYVFGFLGEIQERTRPSFKGMIASFNLVEDGEEHKIVNWVVRCNQLDNGSHQLKIFDNKLYLVETYIQTIKVFDIQNNGDLVLHKSYPLYPTNLLVANAHYIIGGIGDTYTCQGYKHINALTIHDNFIYLSCPSLRNNITSDNIPTQVSSPHVIEVYDMTFKFLWSFTIPDEVFCHDIVFLGHTLYFLAPPNKLCALDIVTKKSTVYATFDVSTLHPRGLSIDQDGNVVIGFRDDNMLVSFNLYNTNKKPILTSVVFAPCCIAKLDYATDFNNCNSSLVKPYVIQIHTTELPIQTNIIENIASKIFEFDWTTCKDTRATLNQGANPVVKLSNHEHTNWEVKSPCDSVFNDISNLQRVINCKIHVSNLEDIPLENIGVYNDIIIKIKEFKEDVKARAVMVSGDLYLYPPNSALGWHTNLEESYNYDTCRCYIVFTTRDNETFFFYRHPQSKLLHAVPDRNKYANIFDLGNIKSPLWHAVYNNSVDTSRLSLGIAFHKYRMGAFGSLTKKIETIFH
jgi:hypothetical protein